MLCFRDMTFCGSDCTNTQCGRHYGPKTKAEAERWWRRDFTDASKENGPPVAFSDFSGDCEDYAPLPHEQ